MDRRLISTDLTFAGYLRISTIKQVAGGKQPVDRQRQAIERWAERHGILISHWFIDVDSRHNTEIRTDFNKMLRMVEEGTINCVVVQDLDRFGIADEDAWGHYRFLFRHRWFAKIYSVTDDIELTGADKVTSLLAHLQASGSADEQEKIANRIQSGLIQKNAQGHKGGGIPPFGFDSACYHGDRLLYRVHYITKHKLLQVYPDGQKVERTSAPAFNRRVESMKLIPSSDAQRLDIVKLVFEWFTSEPLSMRQVALRLNAQGYRIYGHTFKGYHIIGIVTNHSYLGWRITNKTSRARFREVIDGQSVSTPDSIRLAPPKKVPKRRREESQWIINKNAHQPIISEAVFNEAQDRYNNSKRHVRGRHPDYWLRGLLICGHCNKPLICMRTRDGKKAGPYRKGKNKGQPRQAKQPIPTYACPSYHYAKQHGETPICKRNHISHVQAEALVREHLAKTLDAMNSKDDPNLMDRFRPFSARDREWWAIWHQGIIDYCICLQAAFHLPDNNERGVKKLHELLDALMERWNAKVQQQEQDPRDWSDVRDLVDRLEEEKIILAESRMKGAKDQLKKIMLAAIDADEMERKILDEEKVRLRAEVEKWESECIPLAEKLDAVQEEMDRIRRQIHDLAETIRSSASVLKANSTRQLFSAFVIKWRQKSTRPREQELDLEAIEFRPVVGLSKR